MVVVTMCDVGLRSTSVHTSSLLIAPTPRATAGRRTTLRPSFAPSSKVLWSCLKWDDADSHPARARCLTVVSAERPTALARTLAAVSHSYAC